MTKRRDWSAEEKVEIVLAGIKGEKSIAQICRDNNISQTTYYNWRDKFLDSAKSAFRNGTSSNEKESENSHSPVTKATRLPLTLLLKKTELDMRQMETDEK